MWLPDDLALLYAPRTPRPGYRSVSSLLSLARWGRGVSFHDFEVALDMPVGDLPVISSLPLWMREQTRTDRPYRHTIWRRYEKLLGEMASPVSAHWCTEMLDLIIRKP